MEIQQGGFGSDAFILIFNGACTLLWLIAFLQLTFNNSLPFRDRALGLASGAFLLLSGMAILKLLGLKIGLMCWPFLSVGFFFGARRVFTARNRSSAPQTAPGL